MATMDSFKFIGFLDDRDCWAPLATTKFINRINLHTFLPQQRWAIAADSLSPSSSLHPFLKQSGGRTNTCDDNTNGHGHLLAKSSQKHTPSPCSQAFNHSTHFTALQMPVYCNVGQRIGAFLINPLTPACPKSFPLIGRKGGVKGLSVNYRSSFCVSCFLPFYLFAAWVRRLMRRWIAIGKRSGVGCLLFLTPFFAFRWPRPRKKQPVPARGLVRFVLLPHPGFPGRPCWPLRVAHGLTPNPAVLPLFCPTHAFKFIHPFGK